MLNYLTGHRRYRASEHGLILQVESCYWDDEADKWGRWRCEWRDADVYDVGCLELAT